MRRVLKTRAQQQGTTGVSLFPFLAVLICTMGALILLLVVIARQARLQAAEDTAAKQADAVPRLRDEQEWAEVEIREYERARHEAEARLAEARRALGHIEDHARRLRQELARLESTWAEFDAQESTGGRRARELEEELRRLRARVAEAERGVAEARRKAAQTQRSYAIVPYEGPNATRRRPIYVECRRDGVVLQPEGIVFRASDFTGPMGPGNPLDAALRATREYRTRLRQVGEAEEPYPLLLVRPEGITAYYAARAAMESWGSDFGYELIGDDWKLDFDPPDPQLAQEVTQAVAEARIRAQRRMAAAPALRRAAPGYVVSAHRGGLVPAGGGNAGGFASKRPAGRPYDPSARDSAGDGSARRDEPRRDDPPPHRATAGASQGPAVGEPATGAALGGSNHGRTSEGAGGGTPGTTSTPGPEGQPGGAGDGADAPAQPSPAISLVTKSLASARGRNWGLPSAAVGAVPITSPIRIDCYPDRLVLVPEAGLGEPKRVPLGARTEDAIDALIANVWEYMDRWGSAGSGMYWRPVLTFHVAPNAETRYRDLEILLEGSGLDVTRQTED